MCVCFFLHAALFWHRFCVSIEYLYERIHTREICEKCYWMAMLCATMPPAAHICVLKVAVYIG